MSVFQAFALERFRVTMKAGMGNLCSVETKQNGR